MTTTYPTPEGTAADLAAPTIPHLSGNEVMQLRSSIADALRKARAEGYQAGVAEMSLSALRPALASFVRTMNQTLKDNDWKGGWEDMSPLQLLKRLRGETTELERAIRAKKPDADKIAGEAADVANFAMMIADVTDAAAQRAKEKA